MAVPLAPVELALPAVPALVELLLRQAEAEEQLWLRAVQPRAHWAE